MRTLIVAALFAATAALGAQSQPSQTNAQTPQTSSPSPQPDAQQQSSGAVDMPVTVTGCLTASADQKSFTLTTAPRASMPSADATGTSGKGSSSTAGTTGTTAAPVPTIAYTLTTQGSVDLKSHVGHTVEVKGSQPPQKQTVAQETDRSQSSTPAKGSSGASQAQVKTTETAAVVARQLTVTSIRDIASDCRVAK